MSSKLIDPGSRPPRADSATPSAEEAAQPDLGLLSFRGRWRAYQQRVLDELDRHLDDDSLHVVAAPGSGKTLLGLEVMRRLGKPALILAPTITIRDQWEQRLSMFMPEGSHPDWVSLDIKSPKTMTIATYQALHAAFSGLREAQVSEESDGENTSDDHDTVESSSTKSIHATKAADDIIARLKRLNVQTLVLDEAHHLRNEWWNALSELKAKLGKPRLVALTATPPYDVDLAEWQRYQDLCGPIDAEISVPELVLQGDLCPHQDYVYFTLPRAAEAQKLEQFRGDVLQFVETLRRWDEFKAALLQHAWIAHPGEHVETILGDASFFSSMLIFLHALGVKPPAKTLEILGVRDGEIPELSPQWLETLLDGVLHAHRESFTALGEALNETERRLRRIGALDRRRVCLTNPKAVQKLLASSASKLDAIVDITRMETDFMRDELRLVILSDYIRRSELPDDPADMRPIDKMGVIPIFESLRRARLSHIKLGVLTGSMILIPAESKGLLHKTALELDIDPADIHAHEAEFDKAFLHVDVIGEQGRIVRLITELFGRGGITVLVGTQALLGEGWDAPSVNTLILASTVGSYMMSNQIRGRAIRIDPAQPQKTSNIWHLAAVDPESFTEKLEYALTGNTNRQRVFDRLDDLKRDLGSDVQTLKRRFRAFEGLSFDVPVTIENGFRRLALSNVEWNAHSVAHVDELMKQKAADRQKLHETWRQALKGDSANPRMRETLQSNYTPKTLAFRDTIRYLLMQAVFWIGFIVNQTLRAAQNSRSSQDVYVLLLFAFVAGAVATLPMTLKALWLWLRNGSLEGSIKQVGSAVLETLHQMNVIKTGLMNLRVVATQEETGIVHCRLEGATTIERSCFLQALQEVLSPVENPRYVLVRRSLLWRFGRTDYHAVPAMIGQKKENAEYFAKLWNDYVGSSKLVYTRSVEGRLTLLRARTKALSSAFRKKTDRVSRWQ